ncbi:MAG: hypothetical protein QOG83_3735 [Alphaproteobacteria bacterium]|nr:hypothetical protein [Alphaproteobacteria bacterium]
MQMRGTTVTPETLERDAGIRRQEFAREYLRTLRWKQKRTDVLVLIRPAPRCAPAAASITTSSESHLAALDAAIERCVKW